MHTARLVSLKKETKLIAIYGMPNREKVKHELRVQIYELRVQIHELGD